MQEPLVRLNIGEIDTVARVIDKSMREYPTFAWIFPAVGSRRRRIWLWKALARYAYFYGEIWADDERSTVALWVPSKFASLSIVAMIRSGLVLAPVAIGPVALWKLLRFQHVIDLVRKRVTAGPHMYLLLLGTRPDKRKQGAARRLLEDMAAKADAESLPCYLETQYKPNVGFYETLGFRLCDETAFASGRLTNYALMRPAAKAIDTCSGKAPIGGIDKNSAT